METLIRICRHPPRPDAVCRYQNCSNKAQIYLTDPGRCSLKFGYVHYFLFLSQKKYRLIPFCCGFFFIEDLLYNSVSPFLLQSNSCFVGVISLRKVSEIWSELEKTIPKVKQLKFIASKVFVDNCSIQVIAISSIALLHRVLLHRES